LVVPAGGLIVDAEDVCFENIDFVVEGQTTALVELRAASAEFCGCTFRSGTEAAALSALAWRVPVGDNAGASLPTGQLVLVDCIFEGVGAAIVCHAGAARAIELSNVLHRGRGPLVRLTDAPRQDESIRLTLAHVTLRESGPLVESACHEGAAAGIAIVAESCALAPREGEPLVRFRGPDGAARLLANLTWSGQDSLLAAATPFALWSQGDEEPQRLDEQSISVAGLVRSEIGFAAPASRDPAASRATRWLAPLSSTEPPGIEPKRLPAGTKK
jgi:hypothetical protein